MVTSNLLKTNSIGNGADECCHYCRPVNLQLDAIGRLIKAKGGAPPQVSAENCQQ